MMISCASCNMLVEPGHFEFHHRCWKCNEWKAGLERTCPRCGELQIETPDVTFDMILAVRRHECAVRGHSWEVITVYGSGDPVAVLCYHCGKDSGLIQAKEDAIAGEAR